VALDANLPGALEDGPPTHDLDPLALRHRGQSARELAHHAIGLPLAQGVERDARRPQIDAELLRPLGFGEHGRHVQQGLRRDAPLVETGTAQPFALVHDDRLQSQLRTPKGRGVSAWPAADHDDVDLSNEIPHDHYVSLGVPGRAWPAGHAALRPRIERVAVTVFPY